MAVINVSGSKGKTFKILGGTASPNGLTFGSPGDLYIQDNSGAGLIWQKSSGYNTQSNWVQLTAGGSTIYGDYGNDADAAAHGVPIGGWYINNGTSAVSQRLS